MLRLSLAKGPLPSLTPYSREQRNHSLSEECTSQETVTQKGKAGNNQISTMGFLSPENYLDAALLFHSITAK
jgi:hypothetical protein